MTDPALTPEFARQARLAGLLYLLIIVAGLGAELDQALLPQPSIAATLLFAPVWLVQSANFPQCFISRKVKP